MLSSGWGFDRFMYLLRASKNIDGGNKTFKLQLDKLRKFLSYRPDQRYQDGELNQILVLSVRHKM